MKITCIKCKEKKDAKEFIPNSKYIIIPTFICNKCRAKDSYRFFKIKKAARKKK